MSNYDTIIIGGGPAGLSAAIYSSRSKLKTLLLEEKRKVGGQVSTYKEMENYPGVLNTTAPGLMENFQKQAEKFGAEIKKEQVINVDIQGFIKKIKTKSGNYYLCKSIIIATGAEPRKLGVTGEDEFKGKGVSYCATCDADFYVDLEVVVVGNGNSAIEEAIYLTKFARKVKIIVIHDEGIMDADKILQERAYKNEKIEFIWNSTLQEVKGDGLVNTALIKNIKTGEVKDISCDGVFIFIGRVPSTDYLEGKLTLAANGYIKVDEKLEASVAGVFAAGDVREKYLRQVVTAAGDGATAATAAGRYIEEEEYWQENVINSKKTVIIVFWSPTNQNSVNLINGLENINLEEKGAKLVKIDTYKNTRISQRYNITSVPSVLKIKDGEVLEKKENIKSVENIL